MDLSKITGNILSERRVDYKETQQSGGLEFIADCPFCNDNKKHFGMHAATGVWNCFKCGQNGSIFSFLQIHDDVSPARAKYIIHGMLGNTYVDKNSVRKFLDQLEEEEKEMGQAKEKLSHESKTLELPTTYTLLSKCMESPNPMEIQAFLYWLDKRQFPPADLQTYKIGYCNYGKYAGRIIIPIYHNKRLLYFVARDFTGQAIKRYLNPAISTNNIIFNLERASKNKHCVILTEGVFDAIRIGKNAVSLLGKILHAGQKQMLLKQEFEEFVICFDPVCKDPAILESVYKIAHSLYSFASISIMDLDIYGKDAGDCSKAQLQVAFQARETVRSLRELKLRALAQKEGIIHGAS